MSFEQVRDSRRDGMVQVVGGKIANGDLWLENRRWMKLPIACQLKWRCQCSFRPLNSASHLLGGRCDRGQGQESKRRRDRGCIFGVFIGELRHALRKAVQVIPLAKMLKLMNQGARRYAVVRPQFRRPPVGNGCLVPIPLLLEGIAQIVMCLGEVGR